MKRILVGCLLAVLLAPLARGQDANAMHYLELYPLYVTTGAHTNSTTDGINISAYKGNAVVACMFGAGTVGTVTSSVTMVHCATTNGTYATVTNLAGSAVAFTHVGAAAAELETARIELSRLSKYVRVVVNHGEDTNGVSVVLIAPMKSQ